MSINDNNTNGSRGLSTSVVEAAEPMASPAPSQTRDPAILSGKEEPATRFATRAGVKGADGISKSKLILLGGGLAVAVLFFVFTAIVGKSPKKPAPVKQASQSQQAEQEQTTPPQGSVTPLMDTPRTPAPDNTSGQLGHAGRQSFSGHRRAARGPPGQLDRQNRVAQPCRLRPDRRDRPRLCEQGLAPLHPGQASDPFMG